jgi:hypothetical protein
MLGFIVDMINSYGKELKAIIDRDFIIKLLTKLKSFKIKKYELDIAQHEQVILFALFR